MSALIVKNWPVLWKEIGSVWKVTERLVWGSSNSWLSRRCCLQSGQAPGHRRQDPMLTSAYLISLLPSRPLELDESRYERAFYSLHQGIVQKSTC